MTQEYIETIFDESTNQTIQQPMSEQAIKDLQETQARWAIIYEKEEAIQTARTSAQAKLAALGLTADEITALTNN